MTQHFEPGEIAILQNGTYFHEHDGQRCLVLTPLRPYNGLNMLTMQYETRLVYDVEILVPEPIIELINNSVFVTPDQLRKIDDDNILTQANTQRPLQRDFT